MHFQFPEYLKHRCSQIHDFRKFLKKRFTPDLSFQFANPREFKGNAIHMFLAISTPVYSFKGLEFFFPFLYKSDLMSTKFLK